MPPTTHLSPPSSSVQPYRRNKQRNNAKLRKTRWPISYSQEPRKIARSEDHVERVAEDEVNHCPLGQRFARCSSPRSRSPRRTMDLVEKVAMLSCSSNRMPPNVPKSRACSRGRSSSPTRTRLPSYSPNQCVFED